jgi:hypothetical protein
MKLRIVSQMFIGAALYAETGLNSRALFCINTKSVHCGDDPVNERERDLSTIKPSFSCRRGS